MKTELDELAHSVRRFPQELAPTSALPEALDRHNHARNSSPWRTVRLTLYTAAAAAAVFVGGSLLLTDRSPSEKSGESVTTNEKPASRSIPARLFPKTETPSLKRIRDARARKIGRAHV